MDYQGTDCITPDDLRQQRLWSERTFGPGFRTQGIIKHIKKELIEIENDPEDLSEWIDVIILALDGAWRAGYEPLQIIDMFKMKQQRNRSRQWPDWRQFSQDEAIEHVRSK